MLTAYSTVNAVLLHAYNNYSKTFQRYWYMHQRKYRSRGQQYDGHKVC